MFTKQKLKFFKMRTSQLKAQIAFFKRTTSL